MRAIGLKSILLIGSIVLPSLYFMSQLLISYNALLRNNGEFDSRTLNLERQVIGLFNRSVIRLNKNETQNSIYVSWMPFLESKTSSKKTNYDVIVKHPICKRSYWLIILIASDATKFAQRMDIRMTWGKNYDTLITKSVFRIFFLISRNRNADDSSLVEAEMEKFGDIIFRDSYDGNMLFTPSLQTALKWSLKNCNYQYVMLTKDDVYINAKNLIEYLRNVEHKSIYLGHVYFEIPVKREGDYALSKEEYPKSAFSRYCSSAGFVLSLNVVMKMVENFKEIPAFRITDAYVGELALQTGVDTIHNDNFMIYENPYTCVYRPDAILLYPIKQGCMRGLHNEYLKAGRTIKNTLKK